MGNEPRQVISGQDTRNTKRHGHKTLAAVRENTIGETTKLGASDIMQ